MYKLNMLTNECISLIFINFNKVIRNWCLLLIAVSKMDNPATSSEANKLYTCSKMQNFVAFDDIHIDKIICTFNLLLQVYVFDFIGFKQQ